MPERIPQQNSPSREKKRRWDEKMEQMLRPDVYGYVLDEGICDTVVALQLLGFNTTQSDEGNYSDTPWVEVMPEMPTDVYEGEDELKARIMADSGISPEEIDQSSPMFNRTKQVEVEGKARDELVQRSTSYTKEYTEWQAKTTESSEKLQQIIDDFYSAQTQNENANAKVSIVYPYRTPNHGTSIQGVPFLQVVFNDGVEPRSEEQRRERVVLAKEEMRKFTEFLKARFFSS